MVKIHGSNFIFRSVSCNLGIYTCRSGLFKYKWLFGVIVIISMLKKIVVVITIVSLCLLIFLVNTSTPTGIGPFGILAVFMSAYLSLLGVMTFFIFSVSKLTAHLSTAFTVRKPILALSFKKSYYYSTVFAAAPIMLIGLQSVGSISPYELALVALFVVIGCIYITKRTS